MKKLIFLLAVSLQAQVVINDFSPTVKGLTVGTDHTYFWFDKPTVGSLQIACYTTGIIAWNSVHSLIWANPLVSPDGNCKYQSGYYIHWNFNQDTSGPFGTQTYYFIEAQTTIDPMDEGTWSDEFTTTYGMTCASLTVMSVVVDSYCYGYF